MLGEKLFRKFKIICRTPSVFQIRNKRAIFQSKVPWEFPLTIVLARTCRMDSRRWLRLFGRRDVEAHDDVVSVSDAVGGDIAKEGSERRCADSWDPGVFDCPCSGARSRDEFGYKYLLHAFPITIGLLRRRRSSRIECLLKSRWWASGL